MPPKKTTTTKKGPGRPTKKKKTTPEPPPTAASGGRRRRKKKKRTTTTKTTTNNNPGGGFVGTRIEVEYGDRGHEAVVRRDDNLGETGQESRAGLLRVRQAVRHHRLSKAEKRYSTGTESDEMDGEDDESAADERAEDKNESDMEREWMKQEGKRIESDENDESDEEDDDDEDNNNETTDITKTTTHDKKNGGDDTIPDEVYRRTLSTDGSWRWPTMNELFETKMVKAGATIGRVAFVLTTIKFKEAYERRKVDQSQKLAR